MSFFFIVLLSAVIMAPKTGGADQNGPVFYQQGPVLNDTSLTAMPDPAVIAPDTVYRQNGNPAAMDEGLVSGASPAVIEPFHQMDGGPAPSFIILPPQRPDGAVDNNDPIEKNNPFAP